MDFFVIKNVHVVNEGSIQTMDVAMQNGRFSNIQATINTPPGATEINGEGLYLIPGLIDDQVHFREPGLTHKADIQSESRAAAAGGVTSYMEMPNVVPPTLDLARLEAKFDRAAQVSAVNYSFFMGVSNENAEDALQVNKQKNKYCGIKIFMGSSTGSMLVDNIVTLERIFSESEVLIATHCEKEFIVHQNKERLLQEGIEINHARYHPIIRDVEACFESSLTAVQLAKKYGTRLHILHISTAKELDLFTNLFPLADKRITSEVCVHHLHFTAHDYETLGNLIKCNPAIKEAHNKEALWQALLDDRLDIIATDHAPHTWEEKQKPYLEAPAGVPLVQHSLLMLLQARQEGRITLEKIVEKACHAPADCFQVAHRGYIREGYFADAVLLDLAGSTLVNKSSILYKCGWSPFEGHTFPGRVVSTFVNGQRVYHEGQIADAVRGQRLEFNRQ